MEQIREFWIRRSETRVIEQIVDYNVQAESEEQAKQLLTEKHYSGEIISEKIIEEQPYKSKDNIISINEN